MFSVGDANNFILLNKNIVIQESQDFCFCVLILIIPKKKKKKIDKKAK
jgi:hypothetical protein